MSHALAMQKRREYREKYKALGMKIMSRHSDEGLTNPQLMEEYEALNKKRAKRNGFRRDVWNIGE